MGQFDGQQIGLASPFLLAKALGIKVMQLDEMVSRSGYSIDDLNYLRAVDLISKEVYDTHSTIYDKQKLFSIADRAFGELYNEVKQERHSQCENCGETENLHIHHIDLKHYNMDRRNLQLLCRECHFRIHAHRLRSFPRRILTISQFKILLDMVKYFNYSAWSVLGILFEENNPIIRGEEVPTDEIVDIYEKLIPIYECARLNEAAISQTIESIFAFRDRAVENTREGLRLLFGEANENHYKIKIPWRKFD